ncbi:MAG: hypothetical protein H7Y88_09540 [Phycisphaerales bacterium]|nr:hypothetical protein [Phycisphaerales bacterium]
MQGGTVAGGQSERSVSDRVRAVDRAWADAESGRADKEVTRESFKGMVWDLGEPTNVRCRVIEKLMSDLTAEGAVDTANLVRLRLPTETDWTMIETMCRGAADRGWQSVTPGLVRSYARPVPAPSDAERPERRAIECLHPGKDVEQVVFEVFAAPADGEAGERVRQDAWELLGRLDTDGSARASLLAADSDASEDPLLADLQAFASAFGMVPITSMELQWARALRTPEHAEWWSECAQRIAALGGEQREGLSMRHIEAVRLADEATLSRGRDDLLNEVERRVRARKRHNRSEGAADYTKPETLHAWGQDLVWGDLCVMLVLDDAVRQPAVLAELHRQVAQDRQDTSTEHGGVLRAAKSSGSAGDRFEAVGFSPRPVQRLGDTRFVAPEEMIRASDTALAHYHFHAQRAQNVDYAGPGPGDIEFAARSGRGCVVFTSIDDRTLNVDYYIRGGAVIDLRDVR